MPIDLDKFISYTDTGNLLIKLLAYLCNASIQIKGRTLLLANIINNLWGWLGMLEPNLGFLPS